MLNPDQITERLGAARLDAKWNEDPNTGNLHITAYPSKPGILTYKYRMDDGSIHTVRELVTKEVLHNAEVLASLEDKFVLNEHKFDAAGQGIMITTENAKDHQSGWTKGKHVVDKDGMRTRIDGVISDKELINLVKSGKHQVSPGYKAKTSGVGGEHPEYGRFDTEQTWREYNHLSVTWKGRTGDPDIGIRTDSDDNKYLERFDAWEIPTDANNKKEIQMDKITINGHDVEVSKEAAIAFKTYETRVDSDTQALNQKLEGLQKENEGLSGKVEAFETELQKHEQLRLDSELSQLKESSKAILGDDFKFDGLDAMGVKSAIVKQKYPNKNLEGVSADRLDGMYEIAMLSNDKPADFKTDSFKKLEGVYEGVKTPEADPIKAALQRNIENITGGRA